MSSLRILHLSDLHIAKSSFADQQIVLSALFADVESAVQQSGPYDVIFLTGDLIAKGDYTSDNIKLLNEEFIKPLLQVSKVPPECLFIVPGNHDIRVDAIPPLFRSTYEALNTTGILNSTIDDLEKYPHFSSGFEGYQSIINALPNTHRVFANSLFRAYKIQKYGKTIGICAVNSAWCATGRANDKDYGQLLVGQRQIDRLFEAVKDCDLKLALMHHPLSWLAPFDSTVVGGQIFREFNGLFYGHNHNADASQLATQSGPIFLSNAGCLYASRTYFNGYSSVEHSLANGSWTVRAREYYDSRHVFDSSSRFAESGEITFVAGPSTADRALNVPSGDYLVAIREAIDGQMLPSTISDIAPRNLTSLYVEPPLARMSEKQLDDDGSNGRAFSYLSLQEVIRSGKPVFFVGQKESGKTTLLHYICGECSGFGFQDQPRFGSYIDLAVVKPTRASVLEAIVLFSKGAYRRAEFLKLLAEGRMTLCFDNVPASDDKVLGVVAALVAEFPNNRFFFSVHETFAASLTQKVIPKFALESEVVYIHSFGRRQTRALISKWFGDSAEQVRERVDLLLASLRRLNIPRSPFLISILLWVQERNIAFSPVNQAEILEVLVDGMLDKLYERKERSALDSTVKRHFLSELAYELHLADRTSLSHNQLEKFAADYFAKKAFPSASAPFLQEFKEKGILINVGDEVAFKFDCFRAFFLSVKLNSASELLDYALTADGFIRLRQELDYFTGRNRDRGDILRKALTILGELYVPIDLGLDLALFDEFSSEGTPLTTDRRETVEKMLLGERPSIEKQEELLDDMDAEPGRQVTPRHMPPSGNAFLDFIAALQTVSAILRNSELVDDVPLKYEAYSQLSFYWCQVLLAVLASVELNTDEAAELRFKESLPPAARDVGVYVLKLILPNAIFALVLESLGTKKLELIIDKSIHESIESVKKLLSVVLYADLGLKDRLKRIRELSERGNASRFLLELLFFKIVHLFMFRTLSSAEEQEIKALAGDLYSRINSTVEKRTRDNMRARLVSNLDRKRLLLALGEFADDEPKTGNVL